MELSNTDRVYLPSSGTFGHVQKKGGILGLKESYAIVDDHGARVIFTGKDVGEGFVFADSCKTPGGKKTELPVDVVKRARDEFEEEDCKFIINRFLSMEKCERDDVCCKWESMSKEEKMCCFDKERRPETRKTKRISRRSKRTSK